MKISDLKIIGNILYVKKNGAINLDKIVKVCDVVGNHGYANFNKPEKEFAKNFMLLVLFEGGLEERFILETQKDADELRGMILGYLSKMEPSNFITKDEEIVNEG